jgi:hypothetical protein
MVSISGWKSVDNKIFSTALILAIHYTFRMWRQSNYVIRFRFAKALNNKSSTSSLPLPNKTWSTFRFLCLAKPLLRYFAVDQDSDSLHFDMDFHCPKKNHLSNIKFLNSSRADEYGFIVLTFSRTKFMSKLFSIFNRF